LYYSVHGSGPAGQAALVLVHGAGGSHLSWPPQLRRLPGLRVYALDLPGHGRSADAGQASIPAYAQALAAWLSACGLNRVILAGHSMGSAIALRLALDHPDRVDRLVLIGAGARLRVHPDLLQKSGDPATFLEAVSLVVEWSYAEQAPPDLVRLARRRLEETPPQVLQADFQACNGFDITDSLEQVRQPALVVCGQADRMTPPKYASFLASRLPGARLVVIPRAGHMVMLERPDEVAAKVASFLNERSHENMAGLA
jgi:pimeloyl-ACP methyl ester carboxylesterase